MRSIDTIWPFLPTAAFDPGMVMLGTSVCEGIRSPVWDGEATFLCAPPPAGQPSTLWLTELGQREKDMTEAVSSQGLRAAIEKGTGIEVPPAESAPPLRYRDIGYLRRELGAQGAPK